MGNGQQAIFMGCIHDTFLEFERGSGDWHFRERETHCIAIFLHQLDEAVVYISFTIQISVKGLLIVPGTGSLGPGNILLNGFLVRKIGPFGNSIIDLLLSINIQSQKAQVAPTSGS